MAKAKSLEQASRVRQPTKKVKSPWDELRPIPGIFKKTADLGRQCKDSGIQLSHRAYRLLEQYSDTNKPIDELADIALELQKELRALLRQKKQL